MKHLTDEQLSAYRDGALKGRDAVEAERHLDACPPCREALAEMIAQDRELESALTHDPGDQYFETFAARVEDRVRAAGLAGAAARHEGFDFGRFFRSPRALMWVGATTVVVVGGGLALMTSREVLPPTLRARDADRFSQRSAQPSTQPPAVPPPGASMPAAPAGEPAADGKEDRLKSEESGSRVLARDQGAAPAKQQAEAPATSHADERVATTTRAMEVRRTESGEDVPVRKDLPRPAPAPAPSAAGNVAGDTQAHKKTMAEPMRAQPSAPSPTSSLDATSRQESPSFAQPAAPTSTPTSAKAAAGAPAPASGEARVCGSVRDTQGRPIAGAQVAASDLGRSTSSDAKGRFCLSLPPGEHPLAVMAVGYSATQRTVRTGEADAELTLAAVPVLDNRHAMMKLQSGPSAYVEEAKRAGVSDNMLAMMRDAERLEADAAAARSATRYDAAAAAWERAIADLPRGTLEVETRRHLATARYRAWELAPTPARAQTAFEALSRYLERAPSGPDRAQAAAWKDRVKP